MKKICDRLWAECIKARAGWKSELSGKTEGLNAHHLRGKSSYALRYNLDNGICCTNGEHFYGFHHTERRVTFEERVKALRGAEIFEKLESLKHYPGKVDLGMVRVYLEHSLKNFKEGLNNGQGGGVDI